MIVSCGWRYDPAVLDRKKAQNLPDYYPVFRLIGGALTFTSSPNCMTPK